MCRSRGRHMCRPHPSRLSGLRIGEGQEQRAPGALADPGRGVAGAGRVLDEDHVARPDPAALAVGGLDLDRASRWTMNWRRGALWAAGPGAVVSTSRMIIEASGIGSEA